MTVKFGTSKLDISFEFYVSVKEELWRSYKTFF